MGGVALFERSPGAIAEPHGPRSAPCGRAARGQATAELIGGEAKIEVKEGKFEDDFQGYEVKLFKIR